MPRFIEFISRIEVADISDGEGFAVLRMSVSAAGISGLGVGRIVIPLDVTGTLIHESVGQITIPISIYGRNNDIGQITIPLAVQGSGYIATRTDITIRVGVNAAGRQDGGYASNTIFFSLYAIGNPNVIYQLCEDWNNNL